MKDMSETKNEEVAFIFSDSISSSAVIYFGRIWRQNFDAIVYNITQ